MVKVSNIFESNNSKEKIIIRYRGQKQGKPIEMHLKKPYESKTKKYV